MHITFYIITHNIKKFLLKIVNIVILLKLEKKNYMKQKLSFVFNFHFSFFFSFHFPIFLSYFKQRTTQHFQKKKKMFEINNETKYISRHHYYIKEIQNYIKEMFNSKINAINKY